MYQPRQTPGLTIEDLFEETLILVSTDQRQLTEGWVEDYVYVDWGDVFRMRHAEAYPEMETPAVTVGLGSLGLEYILQNGGSGYFPIRVVQPLIDQGKLFALDNAPSVQRPAYMVYPTTARDPESLELALRGLREIVSGKLFREPLIHS
jgi:DNA-binding transcriptional LysR family regulator